MVITFIEIYLTVAFLAFFYLKHWKSLKQDNYTHLRNIHDKRLEQLAEQIENVSQEILGITILVLVIPWFVVALDLLNRYAYHDVTSASSFVVLSAFGILIAIFSAIKFVFLAIARRKNQTEFVQTIGFSSKHSRTDKAA
jgi:hypothetical protein